MEKFIQNIEEISDEKLRLPILPLGFGSGRSIPDFSSHHILIGISSGEALLRTAETETKLGTGSLVFLHDGATASFESIDDAFECEFVLFDASEEFLSHLELSSIAIGESGEGIGISSITKMSAYALEYYHECLKICSVVYSVLAKIARDSMILKLERFDTLSERLSPALLEIEQSYAQPLTIKMLAHICKMSESMFTRHFKMVYGCTPFQYLIKVRLEAAKDLLANSQQSFDEIAKNCGFSSAKYFGDVLRRNERITPSELRAIYRDMTQMRFF